MPRNQKTASDLKNEALCQRCGKTFSAFLQQMEEQNAKVVCPDCGKDNDCPPPPKAARAARKR